MKFYLSAKWQLKDTVSEMARILRARGHELTADWTARANERDYGQDNASQSHEFSEEEIHAILKSDIFIHLSDMGGKGKYVDLGIALAGNRLQRKPSRIYVIGKDADESQFYFNNAVQRVVTNDLVNALEVILSEL